MRMTRTLFLTRRHLLLSLLTFSVAACAGTSNVQQSKYEPVYNGHQLQQLHPERRHVVQTAQAMLGKPYRYGGTSPSKGFDCSGLVQYAHHKAGIQVPRSSASQYAQAQRVSVRNLKPGDLLFFRIGSKLSHVGIYLGDGEFIHAPSSGKRVSKANLSNPYWSERLVSVGNYY